MYRLRFYIDCFPRLTTYLIIEVKNVDTSYVKNMVDKNSTTIIKWEMWEATDTQLGVYHDFTSLSVSSAQLMGDEGYTTLEGCGKEYIVSVTNKGEVRGIYIPRKYVFTDVPSYEVLISLHESIMREHMELRNESLRMGFDLYNPYDGPDREYYLDL